MAFVFLLSCATRPPQQPCNAGLALVNAAAWVQSAAEYRASAMQTYAEARRALDAALAIPDGKPAAVILDLDETSLDNTPFEARMVHSRKTYDADAWKQWVSESAAGATPGAAEFLTYARSRSVTPFYITNRKADEKEATRRNLEKLGYPVTDETLLTRVDTSDKGSRREYVATHYRVLLLLGDDLNDFTDATGKTLEQRAAITRDNAGLWGTSWFILPNPMYGSWESAIAGNGSDCEKLRKKIEALQP
ncbi:MAG TPA: 5'-nucleotidase, lipoprotein e(P4) family [Thermoanaerobaculia bacterium]